MKQYSYCINCGKVGHINYQCKLPIISIGVIAYTVINNQIKYLLINRKDSLGYVDFMRGKYALDDIQCIQEMLNEMTISEHDKLLTFEFDELWKQLWNTVNINKYKNEEILSKERLSKLKQGIIVEGKSYTLESLIQQCKDRWVEPEWGFPKGRRETNERDMDTGLREFSEETGYNINDVHIIHNILPYDELFIGSNYKGYKHRYYIGYIPNNTNPDTVFQETEVSNMLWLSYSEVLKMIRHYDLEKKTIIKKVNTLLTQYSICNTINT